MRSSFSAGAELVAVLFAEVGQHDDERALAQRLHQRRWRRRDSRDGSPAARCRRGAAISELSECTPFLGAIRRADSGRAAEGHRADLVAFLQGDVGEQHQRVERGVEVAAAAAGGAFVGAHASAAVEQEDDALVALVLVLAHDRPALAQRRLPVDVADRVARPVVGELLEIGAAAAHRIALDADLGEAPVAGEPGVARDRGEVRIDAQVASSPPTTRMSKQPASAAHAQLGRREARRAAPASAARRSAAAGWRRPATTPPAGRPSTSNDGSM